MHTYAHAISMSDENTWLHTLRPFSQSGGSSTETQYKLILKAKNTEQQLLIL